MEDMIVTLEVNPIDHEHPSEIAKLWMGSREVPAGNQSVSHLLGTLNAQGWHVTRSMVSPHGDFASVTYYLKRPLLPD